MIKLYEHLRQSIHEWWSMASASWASPSGWQIGHVALATLTSILKGKGLIPFPAVIGGTASRPLLLETWLSIWRSTGVRGVTGGNLAEDDEGGNIGRAAYPCGACGREGSI